MLSRTCSGHTSQCHMFVKHWGRLYTGSGRSVACALVGRSRILGKIVVVSADFLLSTAVETRKQLQCKLAAYFPQCAPRHSLWPGRRRCKKLPHRSCAALFVVQKLRATTSASNGCPSLTANLEPSTPTCQVGAGKRAR